MAQLVMERSFPHRAENDDATDEEHNHKLEKSKLPSRTTAQQPHDQQQKEISEYSVKNGRHQASVLRNNGDLRPHLLRTLNPDSKIENSWACRLQGEIDTGRRL